MGKKLTSWEKSARNRELEREREKKATAVERRRVAYRKAKEAELNEKIESSKEIVEAWELIYENIINLPRRTYELLKYQSSLFQNLGSSIPDKVPPFTREIEIQPIQNQFSIKSYKPSNKISSLKAESKLSIEEYAKKQNKVYISWLDFIFRTKQAYENFIQNKEKELVDAFEDDKKSRENFNTLLNLYEEKIKTENHDFELTIENEKRIIKEDYESFSLELNAIIKNKSENISFIKKEFSNLDKPIFFQVLLAKFPINFDLKPKKYLLKDPSKLKIGLSKVNQKEASVFILVPEERIPITDVQLVMLKEKHSERPLTKIQIKEVEENYYSGLLLSYAYFMFKYTEMDSLQLSVVVNMPDPATGKDIMKIIRGIKIEKSDIDQINISKIIPFESIKKFKSLNGVISQNNIYWSGKNYPNFYSISTADLEALFSNDPIDFPEDFKGVKKIITPKSDELRNMEFKLSKICFDKEIASEKNSKQEIGVKLLPNGEPAEVTNITDKIKEDKEELDALIERIQKL